MMTFFSVFCSQAAFLSTRYDICIRSEEGFCCVQYSVCADETNPFSLSTQDRFQGMTAITVTEDVTALVDTGCFEDFIVIDSE